MMTQTKNISEKEGRVTDILLIVTVVLLVATVAILPMFLKKVPQADTTTLAFPS